MITLEQLTVHQGGFSLVGIDMSIPEGGYGILMGNTGSGKTTLLEAICGLRQVSSGRILLDQIDVTRMMSSARQIGYVPQDAVLFPTMRIDQQIGFGLEIRGEKLNSRSHRVLELAQLLEIEGLLKRYPRGLSGGEKQRVALARALAFRPRLLCLDEPLSALDDSTRTRMTHFLKTIHQEEKVTVLHITHNAVEAQGLGTVQFQLQGGQVLEI
ncbi:MAG: ABC-type sugar transport system ATPase subunit [Mariniblastus sp.]|jgi:ABC-type sugar transport system ATPase subunit